MPRPLTSFALLSSPRPNHPVKDTTRLLPTRVDWRWVLAFATLIFASTLTTFSPSAGLALTLVEFVVVVSCVLAKRWSTAFLLFMVFSTFSYEVYEFTLGPNASSRLAQFSAMPVVGSFAALAILIAIWLPCRLNTPPLADLSGQPTLFRMNRYLNVVIITGIIASFISLLTNNNGVLSLAWYRDAFESEMSRTFTSIIAIKMAILLLLRDPLFAGRADRWLRHIILALGPSALAISLAGFTGFYGTRTDVLLMPLVHFIGFAAVLFPLFLRYENKLAYLICGIIMLIILPFRASPMTGKLALALLFCAILISFLMIRNKHIIIALIVLILGALAAPLLSSDLLPANSLASYKFEQALGVIGLSSQDAPRGDSLDSPAMRIDEARSTLLEFAAQPAYALTGKGFGGTETQHTIASWSLQGTFSPAEVESGVFIRLHESANVLLLKNGLIGIAFFIYVLIASMKCLLRSPWPFIGLCWFVYFYSIYPTLASFGALALVLGLYHPKEVTNANTQ